MDKSNDMQIDLTTEKWNPVTFAVFSGNLPLVKYLFSKCVGNIKKLLKVPGLGQS